MHLKEMRTGKSSGKRDKSMKKFWVVLVIWLSILVAVYQLERMETYVRQNFRIITSFIVAFHWILFFGGSALIGFPLAFLIRKLHLRIQSKLPEKIKTQIRKSKESYPMIHLTLDYFLWIALLPMFFGLTILFIIPQNFGIDTIPLFEFFYYSLPVAGAFYIALAWGKNILEELLEIKCETTEFKDSLEI